MKFTARDAFAVVAAKAPATMENRQLCAYGIKPEGRRGNLHPDA
jgi:hypothetical protein